VPAEPNGDSRRAIADMERKISTIDKVLKRHTYELRDAGARTPTDASRTVYRMTGQEGEVFYFEGPADPSGIDINQVAVELFLKKNERFVSYDSAWTEIQAIWSGLSQANQRIARAKVLRHFDSRPSACHRTSGKIAFAGAKASGTSDNVLASLGPRDPATRWQRRGEV
jgi:hypothetical protein